MKSIRIALSAIAIAMRHPRVWLAAFALVFVTSLLLAWPVHRAIDDPLGHHPVAGVGLDPVLDPDLARQVPIRVSVNGGQLFMMLVWTFLAGGVLSGVGTGNRFRFTEFLTDSGRLFMRNFRVVLIGVPVLVLVFWGSGALTSWIREDLLYDADPGSMSLFGWRPRALSWELLLWVMQAIMGLLFVWVAFAGKVAMARLALDNRRSALAAWGSALLVSLRHPVQSALIVGVLCAIWIGGLFVIGEATAMALEGSGNLWLGLLMGQLGVAFSQIVLIAFFVAARKLLVGHRGVPEEQVEPVVELPRRRAEAPAAKKVSVTS